MKGEPVETNGQGRGNNPWRVIAWTIAGSLLLIPLVAMQVTDEVVWTPADFVFAAVLIGSVGLGIELAARRSSSWAYRGAAVIALAASFFLVWINGAVGIMGNEQDDVNMLFGLVLAVALIGAIVARFRPAGMAWAMGTAAITQLAVPILASALAPGAMASIWAPEALVLSAIFTAMWLLSAWLFRTAAGATS